jgi:sulfotransferase
VIHFISGLPRSGSTLLAAILLQNPRFHAGMTSPVGTIFQAIEKAMSRGGNEYAGALDENDRARMLWSVFLGHHGERILPSSDTGVIFDTNRIWTAKLPALAALFPQAKVVACVRNLAWIMDSLERQVRAHPFELSAIYGHDPKGTVYSRTAALAASTGMVGSAYDALREGFFGEHRDRMLLVEYEALAGDPAATMARIYDFIGEATFPHDFDNVEYSAEAFDLALGAPGMHTVRRKVDLVERETILPPDVFARFERDAFWQMKPYSLQPNVVLER